MKKVLDFLFANYNIGHYELILNNVASYKLKDEMQLKIIDEPDALPSEFLVSMRKYSLLSKKTIARALDFRDCLVVSYIGGLPASYCFFAFSTKRFTFFTLKSRELYFFNCFTFPLARGKGLIYAEVKYVIDEFEPLGYTKANVEIANTNINSIKAFTKLGFKKTKEYHIMQFLFFKFVKEKTIS